MIDQIWIQPSVHVWLGVLVIITSLSSFILAAYYAIRNFKLNRLLYVLFLVTQMSLILQVLIGIKLLDQGLGPLQLYIHYVGGLGAFFFYLLFYWLPQPIKEGRWTALSLTGLSFLFVVMTFSIGRMYVAGS